jgi:hypothetical protein
MSVGSLKGRGLGVAVRVGVYNLVFEPKARG